MLRQKCVRFYQWASKQALIATISILIPNYHKIFYFEKNSFGIMTFIIVSDNSQICSNQCGWWDYFLLINSEALIYPRVGRCSISPHIWFEVSVGNLIPFDMIVGVATNHWQMIFCFQNEMVSNVEKWAEDFMKAFLNWLKSYYTNTNHAKIIS